jgi:hypothetical protein
VVKIESAECGLVAKGCTANCGIGFLTTANGKQTGCFYILTVVYWLAIIQ